MFWAAQQLVFSVSTWSEQKQEGDLSHCERGLIWVLQGFLQNKSPVCSSYLSVDRGQTGAAQQRSAEVTATLQLSETHLSDEPKDHSHHDSMDPALCWGLSTNWSRFKDHSLPECCCWICPSLYADSVPTSHDTPCHKARIITGCFWVNQKGKQTEEPK